MFLMESGENSEGNKDGIMLSISCGREQGGAIRTLPSGHHVLSLSLSVCSPCFQIDHNNRNVIGTISSICYFSEIISDNLCWRCVVSCRQRPAEPPKKMTSHLPNLFIRHYVPKSIACQNQTFILITPRRETNLWHWNYPWSKISIP